MLLRLFRSRSVSLFVLIPLVGILLWTKALISPDPYVFYKGENAMPLFTALYQCLSSNIFIAKVVSLLLYVIITLHVLRINYRYGFMKNRSHLPGILFVLIAAGFYHLLNFHPVYFATIFFLLCIEKIFDSYNSNSLNRTFLAGMFLAIGSLFYFPIIFLFPFVFVGFFIVQKSMSWRNLVLIILGVLVPWLYAAVYYYSTGNIQHLYDLVVQNILVPGPIFFKDIRVEIFLGYILFLTIWGSLVLIRQYEEKRNSSRRYFKCFFWLFIVTIAAIVLFPVVTEGLVVILAIPLSFLIGNLFVGIKSKFWGELFFTILIAMVIILQFV